MRRPKLELRRPKLKTRSRNQESRTEALPKDPRNQRAAPTKLENSFPSRPSPTKDNPGSCDEEMTTPDKVKMSVQSQSPSSEAQYNDFLSDASQEEHVTLHSFTLFPKLPIELRFMIFELAIADEEPRLLSITAKPTPEILTSKSVYTARPSSSFRPPSLLSTNSESREVSLKFKFLSFESMFGDRPIYFIPTRDAVFLDNFESLFCLLDHCASLVPRNNYTQVKADAKSTAFGAKLSTVLYGGEYASRAEHLYSVERLVICQPDHWERDNTKIIIVRKLWREWRKILGPSATLPKVYILFRAEMEAMVNVRKIDETLLQQRFVEEE